MTDFQMQFRNYLATRRSTPFPMFGERAPTEAEIDDILVRAARVPDHGKLAPWRFIIIPHAAGEKLNKKLVQFAKADGAEDKRLELDGKRFTRAPLCIAVVSRAAPHVKIPEWEQVLSSGAACLNLIHAAKAHGYGAVWVTEWMAYDSRVKAELGLEPHENIAGFIHIGSTIADAEDRTRPNMAAIASTYGAD